MLEPLGAADVAPLSNIQKAAIVDALFILVASDRDVTPAEQAELNATLARTHGDVAPDMLDLMLQKARWRVKSSYVPVAWMAWIKEIGLLLPEPALREKLVRSMVGLKKAVAPAITEAERKLLNFFIQELALSPAAIEELKEYGSSLVAPPPPPTTTT